MPAGVYRRVVFLGGVAVKRPRFRHFLGGLCSNRWEREMWRTWRPVFGWRTLCPVLFADPLGMVVVMPRATQPIEASDLATLPDAYPGITAELKAQDYGRLGERIVAVDYGLPEAWLVSDRREYYKSFVSEKRPHFNGERDA